MRAAVRVVAGILLGAFAVYCLAAPRLMKRIPEDQLRNQSNLAERMMGAIGRAESGGWSPGRKSRSS